MVKVIRHKATSSPQTDGLIVFARWHQCALPLSTQLVLPSAHPSPQPKRQIDQFSDFCTAHGKVSSGMPGHVICLIIAPSPGEHGPPSYACFLRPTRVHKPNCISINSPVFARPQSVLILYKGTPLFPSKLPFLIGRSGPHLIHGSLGPPEFLSRTASRSIQPFVFPGLTTLTDSKTDRHTKLLGLQQ